MATGYAIEYRDVVKQFGPVSAVNHINLQIRHGEFFSLLGPSGCGKTTTLRMAAGFETPTQGDILIDEQLQNPLPPYRRPVNTVFQQYALFPHMSVFQNVAFGLEMEKVSAGEKHQRVIAMLEMVQLNGLESRKPLQLSGGQQQRVALARALVKQPKVLLLDEPLGALDLKLRKAMQLELKALQNQVGITFIYVTHDQEEALTMSDRIAVMRDGVVLQVGTPMEIYERPYNRFVADFIGETNFIPGRISSLGDPLRVSLADGIQVLAEQGETDLNLGQAAVVSIRPEKISLFHPNQAPAAPGMHIASIPGRIQQAIYLGTDTRYLVQVSRGVNLVARLQNLNGTENRFHPGEPVEVRWDAHHARVLKE
jgi:spermidine/putrescine transport system ATP-binding protein